MFEMLENEGIERCLLFSDPNSGLRAVLIIDSLALGPAAGGIRTYPYDSLNAALRDVAGLARAMTLKCAIAGLDAGGGKAVILDHGRLNRQRAFARLGQYIDDLGGIFRTAGDLGTTAEDLAHMAAHCRYVHTDEEGLCDSVARGVLRCIEACAAVRGDRDVGRLRIAVQGCGSIGRAVVRALRGVGAQVLIADVDVARAAALAAETGATPVSPDAILTQAVDVVSPCATGGVITTDLLGQLRAWAICGAANNILAGEDMSSQLLQRGILHVPDVVSSAGAVIDGIGRTVMGLRDRTQLIDQLGDTARELLEESTRTGRSPTELAKTKARIRIRERKPPGQAMAI